VKVSSEDFALLAALMVTVGGLVRTTKADIPFVPTVDSKWRPIVALVLGALGGAIDALVRGTPPVKALLLGITSALGAMVGHQAFIEGLRNGVEIGAKAPPAAPVDNDSQKDEDGKPKE